MGKLIWAGAGLSAAALAGVVGGAGWAGQESERQYRAWVDELNRSQPGLHATTEHYNRHWFGAEAVTRLEWRPPLAAADTPPLVLRAEHTVSHGPFTPAPWISSGRWTPRLGAMRTVLRLEPGSALRSSDAEFVQLGSLIAFDGSSTHTVAVAAMQYVDPLSGASLQLDPIAGRFDLSADTRALRGSFGGNRLRLQWNQPPAPDTGEPVPAELVATDLEMQVDQHSSKYGFWPGSSTLGAARVSFGPQHDEAAQTVAEKVAIRVEASGEDQLDVREVFSAERLNIAGADWGRAGFTLSAKRLDASVLAQLRTEIIAGALEALDDTETRQRLLQLGRSLLAGGPLLGIEDIAFNPPGQAPISGHLRIGLRDPQGDDLPLPVFMQQVVDSLDMLFDAPSIRIGDFEQEATEAFALDGLHLAGVLQPGASKLGMDLRLEHMRGRGVSETGITDVSVRGLKGSGEQVRGPSGLFVGTGEFAVDGIQGSVPGEEGANEFGVEKISVGVTSSEQDGYIGFDERFSVGNVTSAGKALGNGELTLSMARLHGPTLVKLQTQADAMTAAAAEGQEPDAQAILGIVNELLSHRPSVALKNVQVHLTEVPSPLLAELTLNLRAPNDWAASDAALQLLDNAHGRIELPEGFLRLALAEQVKLQQEMQTQQNDMERRLGAPAAGKAQNFEQAMQATLDAQLDPLVRSGWIFRSNGKLSSELDYRDGHLQLNGVELPLDQMLSE